MTNHALEEIIAVEQEIEARLAEERQQAAAWLAEERRRISAAAAAALAAAEQRAREKIAAAEGAADDEAAGQLARAEAYAARLQELPEERLRQMVAGRLRRLRPEGAP